MRAFLANLRRLLPSWAVFARHSAPGAAPSTLTPFQVDCACGRRLTGQRRPQAQIVKCPACGAARFVFPASPLPPIAGQGLANLSGPGLTWQHWLVVGLSTVATLALLVVLYQWFFATSGGPHQVIPSSSESLAEQTRKARKHLEAGHFRLAADILIQVHRERNKEVDLLPPLERRQWRQLFAETAVLADRLAESLEDLVRLAAGADEEDWQADFRQRYLGKAVLFEQVLQSKDGQLIWTNPLGLEGGRKIRLALNDLTLLRQLNLEQESRVLFGARLASVRREPPGTFWVIHFQKDSGVLLTEATAAKRVCPTPWAEEAVQKILATQKKMILELP